MHDPFFSRLARPFVPTAALLAALVLHVCVRPASAAGEAAAPQARARIAFDERLSAPPVLAAALDAMGSRAPAVPVLARITVTLADLQGDDATRFARLEQRLALYQQKKIAVWLALDASARRSWAGDRRMNGRSCCAGSRRSSRAACACSR